MANIKKKTSNSKTTKKTKTSPTTKVKSEPKAKVKPKVKAVRKKKVVEHKFVVEDHILVPKHTKLTETEREKLFLRYKISTKELPKILITDPAIKKFSPKLGDVIKIERVSKTAGKSIFYRGVVNE